MNFFLFWLKEKLRVFFIKKYFNLINDFFLCNKINSIYLKNKVISPSWMDIQKSPREGEDQIDDRLLNDIEHKIVVGIFGILLVSSLVT